MGAYAKAFVLLEPWEFLVGTREVFGGGHGRARKYHVLVDDGMAACKPNPYRGMLLYEDSLRPIGEIPGCMACAAPGCRVWFEAYLHARPPKGVDR